MSLNHFWSHTYCVALNCLTMHNRTQNTQSNWQNCYFDTNLQVIECFPLNIEQLPCLQSYSIHLSLTHSMCTFYFYYMLRTVFIVVICSMACDVGVLSIECEIYIVTIHLLHLCLRTYVFWSDTKLYIFIYIKMVCLSMFNEELTSLSLALQIFSSIFPLKLWRLLSSLSAFIAALALIVDA